MPYMHTIMAINGQMPPTSIASARLCPGDSFVLCRIYKTVYVTWKIMGARRSRAGRMSDRNIPIKGYRYHRFLFSKINKDPVPYAWQPLLSKKIFF
jgi:hypothetical protein